MRSAALLSVAVLAVLLAGCVEQNNNNGGPGDASGVTLIPSVKGCAATSDGMATKSMAEGVEQAPKIEVIGNEVVYSRATNHQCCRKVEVTKEAQASTINVYESWTGLGCKCMCFSEIEARLQNLPAGTYTVNVYSKATDPLTEEPMPQGAIISQEVVVQPGQVIADDAQNQAVGIADDTQNPLLNATAEAPGGKESCEAAGGNWVQAGLNPQEVCILPTTDAGKLCFDSSQCEGICEADPGSLAYLIVWRFHIPFPSTGVCSAVRSSIGCHGYVENGMVYGILCID
jgi:hypothetical protein